MKKLILPLLILALAVLVAREIRYYLEERARRLAYERWRAGVPSYYVEWARRMTELLERYGFPT